MSFYLISSNTMEVALFFSSLFYGPHVNSVIMPVTVNIQHRSRNHSAVITPPTRLSNLAVKTHRANSARSTSQLPSHKTFCGGGFCIRRLLCPLPLVGLVSSREGVRVDVRQSVRKTFVGIKTFRFALCKVATVLPFCCAPLFIRLEVVQGVFPL